MPKLRGRESLVSEPSRARRRALCSVCIGLSRHYIQIDVCEEPHAPVLRQAPETEMGTEDGSGDGNGNGEARNAA